MKKQIIVLGTSLALASMIFTGCNSTKQANVQKADSSVDMEFANPQRGQKIYAKMFYTKCGITCGEMAKKHTQDEWEQFFKEKKVGEAIGEYCPIMDELNEKEQRLVYDFMYHHASDSGHVADCED